MLPSFFQEVWRRLQASGAHPNQPSACLAPADAVNLVIEATFPGLRAMPGFPARLQDPVMRAMNHIGDMVEQLPTAISCRRSSYVSLPEVNALFSGPDQIQQVFSASDAVRALFDQYPDLDQCWVLLCAQKQERHQFGMALCGDQVRRDVPHTQVCFTDHQILSPGISEEDARKGLKCCIFENLITYIQQHRIALRQHSGHRDERVRLLRQRLRQLGDQPSEERLALGEELAGLEANQDPAPERLDKLQEQMDFLLRVFGQPADHAAWTRLHLHLDRLGRKLDDSLESQGYELSLSEFRIAYHQPRVVTLARFPRDELLPAQDYLTQAEIILAN